MYIVYTVQFMWKVNTTRIFRRIHAGYTKLDFFQWGQTREHGTTSGKSNFSPCSKSTTFRGQGRGRYNLQSSSSVVSRLGPNPTQMTHKPHRSETTKLFHSHTYIAGNVRNCVTQWKALTQDPWIYHVVERLPDRFSSVPHVQYTRWTILS